MEKPMTCLCLSYFPLSPLQGAGELYNAKELLSKLGTTFDDLAELSDAKACLWCRYNEKVTPVFVLRRGREICEHLKIWSDGKPEDWFTLYIVKHDKRYAVVLFPKVRKSVERFKIAQLHFNGTIIPEDAKIEVICKPLVFVSINVGMIEKVQVGDKMYLGFSDASEIDVNNIQSSPEPLFIGPIEVKQDMNDENQVYLKTIFERK